MSIFPGNSCCVKNRKYPDPLGITEGVCPKCFQERREFLRVRYNEVKMSKHTPGPWFSKYTDGNKTLAIESALIDQGFGRIATVHFADEANARLIAAAPEMLEVLETIENDDGKIPTWLWERIQSVVKKAGGL